MKSSSKCSTNSLSRLSYSAVCVDHMLPRIHLAVGLRARSCIVCLALVYLCGLPALFPAHHRCHAPRRDHASMLIPPRLNADPPTPLSLSSSPSFPSSSSSSSSSAREEEIDDLRLTMQEQKQVFHSQIEALVAK